MWHALAAFKLSLFASGTPPTPAWAPALRLPQTSALTFFLFTWVILDADEVDGVDPLASALFALPGTLVGFSWRTIFLLILAPIADAGNTPPLNSWTTKPFSGILRCCVVRSGAEERRRPKTKEDC